MKKINMIILIGCLLLAGCEEQPLQDQAATLESPPEREVPVIPSTKTEPVEQEQSQPELKAACEADDEKTGDIELSVRILTVSEQDFTALEELWDYTTVLFVMTKRTDLFPRSGLKIQAATADLSEKLDELADNAAQAREKRISLTLENYAAEYMKINRRIKIPKFDYLTRQYTPEKYNFEKAVGGFKIIAQKVPQRELINMRLTPVLFDFLSDGGNQVFDELRTAITVKPNQSVLIGSAGDPQNDLASALLGSSVGRGATKTIILINASIL